MILDSRSIAAGEAEFSWHRFVADAHQWMARVETVSSQHDDYSPSVGFGMSQAWDVPSVSAGQPKYTKPVVLMISNANVSHGETLAQLFRIAGRAVLVGEPTNGTYGVKEGVVIPGGAVFHFTTGRALFPDGQKYHGIGVVPEVPAAPTMAGLRAGRDEVYEKAVETLEGILAGRKISRSAADPRR
jgi:C-terminal processing protease CtpA/Prc